MAHQRIAASWAEQRASTDSWTLLQHYILNPLLDLIFPPVCVGCGRVGEIFCPTCMATIDQDMVDRYPVPAHLSALAAVGQFSGVLQKAVHTLKYEHFTAIAKPLGALMADQINQWPPALLLPVPLHEERFRQRGYNQSALLGQALAKQLNWSFADNVLTRTRSTPSQVGLNYQARQKNVKDAFTVVKEPAVKQNHIVLIDDVCTTGATLSECASALLSAGACDVRAIVVGRAVLVP